MEPVKDYIKNIEGAERRFFSSEVRKQIREAGSESEKPLIEGYAAKFNSVTVIGYYWKFEEVIAPGAFSDVLNDDVRCLFNHEPEYILARSNNGQGTLSLVEDAVGLKYSYETPNRSYALDLADAIEKGDVTQSSFAFEVAEEEWIYGDEEKGILDRRVIKKFKRLFDVAPVTFPAYEDTEVAKRSLSSKKQIEGIEVRGAQVQSENNGLSIHEAQLVLNKNKCI